MLYSIYWYIILEAVTEVVKVVVFELSVYSINSYINSRIERSIIKAVVYREYLDISLKYYLTDYSIFYYQQQKRNTVSYSNSNYTETVIAFKQKKRSIYLKLYY